MGDPSEQELLAAARAGDAAALEGLVRRYQPRVYRFGMKMCGDPEDAKDVLQETLLAMARGVRDFRGASSLSTWLYTIARSFCIKKRRSTATGPATAQAERPNDGTRLADLGPGPEEILAKRQLEAALARAIAELEPMYREVLVLRDIEGLTAPEVAEVLGIGVAAVKSRLHRARAAVRDALARILGSAPAERPPAPGCPDVLTLFSRHLEGEISAGVCAEMERHLDACDACRERCDSLRRTLSLCSSAPTPEVPEEVQESIRRALAETVAARAPG